VLDLRFGIDDTKYIMTLQEAMLELVKYKQLCPQTIDKLNAEHIEVKKILKKYPSEKVRI